MLEFNNENDVEKTRVNLYMPKYIVDYLDGIAKEIGGTRTSLINVIALNYINSVEDGKNARLKKSPL